MKNTYTEMFSDLVHHIEFYLYDNDPCYLVMEEKAILDVALMKMYNNDIPLDEELIVILEKIPQARRLSSVLKEHPYNKLRI